MATIVTNDKLEQTLPPSFFERDTVLVARELLGTLLCRRLEDGTILSGAIVEAEAYTHDDPACHAYRGKTSRCEVMFGPGGYAYVYFIYGMYFCLNVVTEVEGIAGAVLIRAIEFDGANGPGKLCREWAIDRSHNGVNLMDSRSPIWLARGTALSDQEVEITKRIGLSVAQDQLWRYTSKGHPSVSGQRNSVTRSRSKGAYSINPSRRKPNAAASLTTGSKPASSKRASSKASTGSNTKSATTSSKSDAGSAGKSSRKKTKI